MLYELLSPYTGDLNLFSFITFRVALALATSAYVLEAGRIRYHGTAAELRDNPDLLHSAYLLRDAPGSSGGHL